GFIHCRFPIANCRLKVLDRIILSSRLSRKSAIGNRKSAILLMRSARSINSVRQPPGDKREAILRAATTVFAHNGYFNAKVADIAREAGVADGTVYLYFKSKEEMLHSIFDRSVD